MSDDDLVKQFLAKKGATVLPEKPSLELAKKMAKDRSDALAYNYGIHFRKTYGKVK